MRTTSELIKLVKILHQKLLPQTKFIEKYYAEKSGKNIKIVLSDQTDTSYFTTDNQIVISLYALVNILKEVPGYESSLYYTLQMHEIGHALYTDMDILKKVITYKQMTILNILEDNRIEHLVNKWNASANFKVLKYITQDKVLNPDNFLGTFLTLSLGLLRTVDNRAYVGITKITSGKPELVDEILALAEKYKLTNEKATGSYLLSLAGEVQTKIEQLFEALAEQQKQKSEKNEDAEQAQEQNDTENSEEQRQEGDQDANQENGQGKLDQEKEEEQEEDTEQDSDEKEKEQDGELMGDPMDELLDEIKDELNKLKQKNIEDMKELGEIVAPLVNEDYPELPYEPDAITVFDTVRRSSIKGGSSSRYQGNAKELVMKRYLRREFVQNEKLFQKRDMHGTEKDKSVKVAFFLDISGSMTSYEMEDKKGRLLTLIETATNYLKSFYDLMHTRIDIKMYAFGRNLWTITRKELNSKFLTEHTEGATRIPPIAIPKDTEIIVLTDGQIHGMASMFIKRANFVVIGRHVSDLKEAGARNVIETNQRDMVDDLNRATAGLAKILGGK